MRYEMCASQRPAGPTGMRAGLVGRPRAKSIGYQRSRRTKPVNGRGRWYDFLDEAQSSDLYVTIVGQMACAVLAAPASRKARLPIPIVIYVHQQRIAAP